MKTAEHVAAEMMFGALLKVDIVEPLRDVPSIINMGCSFRGLVRGQTSLCLGIVRVSGDDQRQNQLQVSMRVQLKSLVLNSRIEKRNLQCA